MAKQVLTISQTKIMTAFQQTGRIAILYPRRKAISCNGFPPMTIQKAVDYMSNCLRRLADETPAR